MLGKAPRPFATPYSVFFLPSRRCLRYHHQNLPFRPDKNTAPFGGRLCASKHFAIGRALALEVFALPYLYLSPFQYPSTLIHIYEKDEILASEMLIVTLSLPGKLVYTTCNISSSTQPSKVGPSYYRGKYKKPPAQELSLAKIYTCTNKAALR
jgi:hypothetical protein